MSGAARAGRMRLTAAALAAAVVVAGRPQTSGAHEVGTTAVTATIDGSRYSVTIALDPRALLAKLDRAAGRPRSAPLAAAEYGEALRRRADEILQHTSVVFDGRSVAPTVEAIDSAPERSPTAADDQWPTAPRISIRLTGAVPRGARAFRWSYDLTFASYALIVKQAGGPIGRVEWLEGGQTSAPFEIGTRARAWVDEGSFGGYGPAVLGGGALLMCALVFRRARLRAPSTRRRPWPCSHIVRTPSTRC